MSFGDQLLVTENGLISDFALARNQALKKAQGDWVLFVDDDEVVTPELATEIKKTIVAPSAPDGFRLRRQDILFGHSLRFGETGNFCEIRLAKKGAGEWRRPVHEHWQIDGVVGQLRNPLLHIAKTSVNSFVEKINFYTDLDAREFLHSGQEFSYFELLAKPLAKFFLNYFLRLGFLDGLPGFVMAYMMSLNSLTVRVKMYDFSQTP